jgi:hypothetical protein
MLQHLAVSHGIGVEVQKAEKVLAISYTYRHFLPCAIITLVAFAFCFLASTPHLS